MARTPSNFRQIGSTGLTRYGPYIYEEFVPALRWPGAGRIYQEMSDNDPVIGAILYLAEMLIRGTNWDVKAASDKKEDIELAEFVKSCMNDMDSSWANTICEILSMLVYGFSFHEIVYKVRRGPKETNPKYKSKYKDGRVGWRRLPVRAQTSLHSWEFNDEGDVVTFLQQAPEHPSVIKIPMSKGLLFRTRISKDNPEGKSLLRNAYRPWFFKKHFEEIEGIGIERDLAGFPVLQAPEDLDLWNKDDPDMVTLKKDAESLVSSIRRDSEEGVLLPHGWDLKLLTSGSARAIDIGATIDRYDNRIAITMLSDIILIGGNRTGSFALADTKQSMIAAALQAQLLNISDVFNAKAIPDLLMMNGIEVEEMPRLEPGEIHAPSLKEIALMLRAMGLPISQDHKLMNHLRHITSMPELTKEDFDNMYKDLEDEESNDTAKPSGRIPDDSAQNIMEMADGSYTGGA